MSLTQSDEQRIIELFEEKAKQVKDSEEYYRYRDLIFTDVLSKLNDYFSVLKRDWKVRYRVNDDDGVSIIHDGLLAAVNTFDYRYTYLHKQKLGTTKFITYLTHILQNLARNYWYRNHISKKRERTKWHKVPTSIYVSLDTLLERVDQLSDYESLTPVFRDLMGYLSEKSSYFDSAFNQKFFISQLLEKLPADQRVIVQSIVDGYKIKEIAKSLNITPPAVRSKLKAFVRKFNNVEYELCPSENHY